MIPYRAMYLYLFNQMTDMLETLESGLERNFLLHEVLISLKNDIYAAQRKTEDMMIEAEEPGIILLSTDHDHGHTKAE